MSKSVIENQPQYSSNECEHLIGMMCIMVEMATNRALAVVSHEGKILLVNGLLAHQFGENEEAVLGQEWTAFFYGNEAEGRRDSTWEKSAVRRVLMGKKEAASSYEYGRNEVFYAVDVWRPTLERDEVLVSLLAIPEVVPPGYEPE